MGYGDIKTIKELDVATFMELVHYEEFQERYLQAFRDMNRERK